jgi:uncharacterized damage-inducible protein DinB
MPRSLQGCYKLILMNVKDLMELFDYNLWANNRLFEAAAQLPSEQYFQNLKFAHEGIHGTLTHIVGAQKVWLMRWLKASDKTLLRGKDVGSLLELIAIWERVSSETAEFLATFTDQTLQQTMTITTTTGKQYTHTFQQMMQHLVNHSTAHRGQVQAMMRQYEVLPPVIDMITYYRRKQT